MTPALQVLFGSQFVMPREQQKSSWGSLRYLAEALTVRTVEFCRQMLPLANWSTREKQSVLKTRLTMMVCYLSILFADAPYSELSWTAALGQYRSIALLLKPLLSTNASSNALTLHCSNAKRSSATLNLPRFEVDGGSSFAQAVQDLYNACLQAFQHLSLQLWRGFLASASTLPITEASCAVAAKVQSQRWLNFASSTPGHDTISTWNASGR